MALVFYVISVIINFLNSSGNFFFFNLLLITSKKHELRDLLHANYSYTAFNKSCFLFYFKLQMYLMIFMYLMTIHFNYKKKE